MSRTAKDFHKETLADQARRAWIQERIDQILARVSAFDVLRQNGVAIRQVSDNQPEQIRCPFHGLDNKPSARLFPTDAQSPSHIWCYVCQKRWDAIGLWRMFAGGYDNKRFVEALTEMERAYGLKAPEMSREAMFRAPEVDEDLEAFNVLFDACEGRLSLAKRDYHRLDDMTGYLTASSILDKVRHRVDRKKLPPGKGVAILERLRDKIGEKIRS